MKKIVPALPSPREYLTRERRAKDKHEYYEGRNAYMYPDATIVCGTPDMEDDQFDTLKNPRVIIEVLSHSTAAHDRGRKFLYYQQIPSFQEYVLIDSTEYFVEVSRRQKDGSWDAEASSDPDGWLALESMKMNILLGEIYRKVF